MYDFIDTRNGRKYSYKSELEARAVARIAGMKQCPPKGWPIEPVEGVHDCVALPEPRKPSWLFWLFIFILAGLCSLMTGAFVHALINRHYF